MEWKKGDEVEFKLDRGKVVLKSKGYVIARFCDVFYHAHSANYCRNFGRMGNPVCDRTSRNRGLLMTAKGVRTSAFEL